jgi:hypothetical protein
MERELRALIKALNDLLAAMAGARAVEGAVVLDARQRLEAEILAVMRERSGRWLKPTEIAALCPSAPEGQSGPTRVGFALIGLTRKDLGDGWHVERGQPVGTRTSHYRTVHTPERT